MLSPETTYPGDPIQTKDIVADLMDDGQINLSHRPKDEAVHHPELTDQQLRYFGYIGRLGRLVKSTARYLAYTSDLGEAFRPIVPPWVVKASYGVSWAYVVTDVSLTAYSEKDKGTTGSDLREIVVKRAVFQSMASMALPAFTIHQSVHLGSWAFKKYSTNPVMRRWGPTVLGLAVVPFLPYIFDEPVEIAVEKGFNMALGWKERLHSHGHEQHAIPEGKEKVH
ncbi:mitochondrial 18 KDa protein-domain-containing protein [Hyaloraphidium curvatum]|nr:mitochondrial 18 KDa protein-domain-containing protein [Hyaloraphidium curvatum]